MVQGGPTLSAEWVDTLELLASTASIDAQQARLDQAAQADA